MVNADMYCYIFLTFYQCFNLHILCFISYETFKNSGQDFSEDQKAYAYVTIICLCNMLLQDRNIVLEQDIEL